MFMVTVFGMHIRSCGRISLISLSAARLETSKTESEMAMMPPATIAGGRKFVWVGFGIARVIGRGWLLNRRRDACYRRHEKQQESSLHYLIIRVDAER